MPLTKLRPDEKEILRLLHRRCRMTLQELSKELRRPWSELPPVRRIYRNLNAMRARKLVNIYAPDYKGRSHWFITFEGWVMLAAQESGRASQTG